MSVHPQKVTYQVHLEVRDDDGNVTGEYTADRDQSGQPFTLFPLQLTILPEIVAALVAGLEAQHGEDDAPPPNRAARRAKPAKGAPPL